MLAHARPMARQEARAVFSRNFEIFETSTNLFIPNFHLSPAPSDPRRNVICVAVLLLQSADLSFLGEEGRLSVQGSREIARYCRYSRMKTDGARFHGVCRHGWEETDTGETVLKVVRKKKWNERRSPDDRAMT